jgi:DMSO/TMAO reductase YedYZ molybdopterin-dependent catalytic subunit
MVAAPAPGSLAIVGDVPAPITLTIEELAKLPRQTASVTGSSGTAQRFEGVALEELLKRAGMAFGEQSMGGDNFTRYVVAEGSDGYRALFAIPEIDPGFTDRVILVADRQDGKPLGEAGGWLRLVVPGEKLHSRWVHHLTTLRIGRAPAPAGY